MNKQIKCEICGKKGFKNRAGLEGHKKISHGIDNRKTYPDEISKRLEALEKKQERLVKTLNSSFQHQKTVIESVSRLISITTNLGIELWDLEKGTGSRTQKEFMEKVFGEEGKKALEGKGGKEESSVREESSPGEEKKNKDKNGFTVPGKR